MGTICCTIKTSILCPFKSTKGMLNGCLWGVVQSCKGSTPGPKKFENPWSKRLSEVLFSLHVFLADTILSILP